MKSVRISGDLKDADGRYIRHFMAPRDKNGEQVCNFTRAGVLWTSIRSRCKAGKTAQINRKSYESSINSFKDFHTFAEWCQNQHGYMNRDTNGKFWHLDKDIILPFNKVYSETTCCFVPVAVNSLFTYSTKTRGEYPLGVHKSKKSGKFVAQINKDRKRVWLGEFSTPTEAHRIYQIAKIESIDAALIRNTGVVDDNVIKGMILHRDIIILDLENNLETVR